MQLTLQIIDGPDAGMKIWIRQGQLIEVGRSESNDLAIPSDPQLSSAHFALEFGDKICKIRDKNSTNGTFINGQRVEEADLHDGDEIVAGQTRIAVRIDRSPRTNKGEMPVNAGVMPAETASSVYEQPSTAGESPTNSINQAVNATEAEVTASGPITEAQAQDGAEDAISPETLDSVDDLKQQNVEPDASLPGLLDIVNETPFTVATMLSEFVPGEAFLTVVVKATFSVRPNREVQIADQQILIFNADILDDPKNPASPVRFESDMVPFKLRADVVVVGSAYAPGGRPVPELDVQLRVGALSKTIRVFGDRKWSFPSRILLIPDRSDPEPFVQMPLTYTRAFGGINAAAALYCKENLVGVGFIGSKSADSIHDQPLPNLEDPNDLIDSWKSQPKPVGFGFYGRGWMPRLRYAGTYDDNYKKEQAPQLPRDFSYELFNGAHPDLQVPGYLQGGEEVELNNLSSDGSLYFRLPRVSPSVTISRFVPARDVVTREEAARAESGELELKTEDPVLPVLDTIVFLPEHRLFYEVFRCVFPLPSLDDINIQNIKITV